MEICEERWSCRAQFVRNTYERTHSEYNVYMSGQEEKYEWTLGF